MKAGPVQKVLHVDPRSLGNGQEGTKAEQNQVAAAVKTEEASPALVPPSSNGKPFDRPSAELKDIFSKV